MHTAEAVIDDFFGQSPIGAKTSVLLANHAQAAALRSTAGVEPIRVSREQDLKELVAVLRTSNRSHKAAAIMDAVTHALIQDQLPPTGENVPVFPWFSRAGGPHSKIIGNYIEITQNKVTTSTLAALQSQFRTTANSRRPKVVFVVDDRDKAHKTFAKLNSSSDVFTHSAKGVRRTDLPDSAANDFERLAFTRFENHRSAAISVLPETDDARVDFINRLMHLRSQKTILDPSHLLPELKALCDHSNRKLVLSANENREFWASAWIHTLVEQAYVQDSAKFEIQSAMGMLQMVEEQGLASHVLRFSNQVLGTTPEALGYLEDGVKRFESLPVNCFSYEMYLPSHLGLLQNKHVTELFQRHQSDPDKAYESYNFASAEAPFFTNLAMLGNAAALGFLTSGRVGDAVRLYDELIHVNADEIDRWSIICNRLIAHHLYYGEVSPKEIEAFALDVINAQVSSVWEYHIIRFALNLIGIDKAGLVTDAMWRLLRNSTYFSGLESDEVEPYLKLLIEKDFADQAINGRLTGQMGEFVHNSLLFPSSDFDWT